MARERAIPVMTVCLFRLIKQYLWCAADIKVRIFFSCEPSLRNVHFKMRGQN